MARRRRAAAPKGRDDDIRLMAALVTFGVTSMILMAVMLLAPVVKVGPSEGELAPDFSVQAYSGGEWGDFRLSDLFNKSWAPGGDGNWIVVQYIDTDCPYCWNEGELMSQLHSQWNQKVTFITVVVELGIQGHDSSRGEVEAFRDKTPYEGCKTNSNCADRPGNPHSWVYIDDLNSRTSGDWELPGTPFAALLQPDGIVAWNPQQPGNHPDGEEMEGALQRLVGGS
tara:strand:+ start:53 stop:730 length:678 start_codon:yes stop_codon:yes gene_type:complete